MRNTSTSHASSASAQSSVSSLLDVYPLLDLTLEKGLGAVVTDAQGQDYLDFYGGHAVISIGHQHPHWIERLTRQMKQLSFYSNSVHLPIQEEFARKLTNVAGKEEFRLFLCNSGAEANENAMKLASFHTGRSAALAFKGGFHGRTSLAVAVTDNVAIQALINSTDFVHRLPINETLALRPFFEKHGEQLACAIVEGIQGVGGIIEAGDSFLKELRELCDQYRVLLIADSVQCGYGRSGHFFTHDQSGISADIYTMAKGMGNGFPVAGILCSPNIRVEKGQLGTTFGGNPLACAAGLAVLEVMESEQLLQNVIERGAQLMEGLSKISFVENLRGRGLMIGFDTPSVEPAIRMRLLKEHRVLTGFSKPNVIRLLPPLNITEQEVEQFLNACQQVAAAL